MKRTMSQKPSRQSKDVRGHVLSEDMGFIKLLDWDSRFFGFNIGRIVIDAHQLHHTILDKAVAEARANNIKCLYLEMPFGPPDVLAYCSGNGFSLVDFRTTLFKRLESEERELCVSNITCKLKDEYYHYLTKTVEQISALSRYAYDPRFGKQWSHRLYEEWLRRSFYEKYCDEFIVYIKGQEPVGFLTVRIKNKYPFIDLLGVLEGHRREGIGGCLIGEAERKLLKIGHKVLKVVTQGHNIGALKIYQKRGYEIETVNIFYHKWID